MYIILKSMDSKSILVKNSKLHLKNAFNISNPIDRSLNSTFKL